MCRSSQQGINHRHTHAYTHRTSEAKLRVFTRTFCSSHFFLPHYRRTTPRVCIPLSLPSHIFAIRNCSFKNVFDYSCNFTHSLWSSWIPANEEQRCKRRFLPRAVFPMMLCHRRTVNEKLRCAGVREEAIFFSLEILDPEWRILLKETWTSAHL